MPFFITTLHVAIEAKNIDDAHDILSDAESQMEHLGVLTEVAWLPGGLALLAESPGFDPQAHDLKTANAVARGDAL